MGYIVQWLAGIVSSARNLMVHYSLLAQVLKVLRVTRPPLLPFDEAPPISKRSRILGRGPGSATIQEEASARLALNYTSTDVGWGHSRQSLLAHPRILLIGAHTQITLIRS